MHLKLFLCKMNLIALLFLLIGLFGSDNKVRASFYLFLYTLLGSLFLLLAILTMSTLMGTTDFDALFKMNFNHTTQIVLFAGVFIAFAVKTPTIFLNSWLLKAHVESPLGGSIILAAKSMAAFNLAICWEHHVSDFTWSISRKLYVFSKKIGDSLTHIFWENIVLNIKHIGILSYMILKFSTDNIKLNRIPRGHTLEVMDTNTNNDVINNDDTTNTNNDDDDAKINKDINKNFGSYLAGLIEGDGSIYVPKNPKGAPMIVVAFHSKDLPLALFIQKNLNAGNVYKIKGKNAYNYTISDIKGLIKVVKLINGYMRTPKIVQLYKLIDLISTKGERPTTINKLPIDNTSLDSNAWLSGFIDADGCFSVRVSQNKHCSTKKIAVMLALAQKTVSLNNDSLLDIMTKISIFLDSNLKTTCQHKHPQYLVRTCNLKGNLAVRAYLTKYPLFSGKYLDFLVWEKVLIMMVNKEHKKNAEAIIKLKESMNSRRTHFNWNHLNKFYPYK